MTFRIETRLLSHSWTVPSDHSTRTSPTKWMCEKIHHIILQSSHSECVMLCNDCFNDWNSFYLRVFFVTNVVHVWYGMVWYSMHDELFLFPFRWFDLLLQIARTLVLRFFFFILLCFYYKFLFPPNVFRLTRTKSVLEMMWKLHLMKNWLLFHQTQIVLKNSLWKIQK